MQTRKVKLTRQHRMLHNRWDDQVGHLAVYWAVDSMEQQQLHIHYENIKEIIKMLIKLRNIVSVEIFDYTPKTVPADDAPAAAPP